MSNTGAARTIASAAAVAALMLSAAACGGSESPAGSADATLAPSDTTASPNTDAPATPATITPATITPATITPATSAAPTATDAAIETAPPTVAEATAEFMAFAETDGQLVNDWSTQLNAFGEQAIDLIDDVSAAPAAGPLTELSNELVEAIGPATTDPDLVTLRTFAEGASLAIGYAVADDQDAALSIFLGLQSQADTLTAVLDRFDA